MRDLAVDAGFHHVIYCRILFYHIKQLVVIYLKKIRQKNRMIPLASRSSTLFQVHADTEAGAFM